MATLLYRLGRFSYRRAWLIIGIWTLVLAGILGGGIALGGKTQESFAIPGTESQDALDSLTAVFPQVAGASAQAIVVAPEGSSVTDDASREAIAATVSAIKKIDGIDSVVGPFDTYAGTAVTDDEQIARIQVQFDGISTDVTPETLKELTATGSIGTDAGLQVEFGGQVFADNTFGITITEVFGVLFAGLVLLITFGSLAAAGMPLLSALIGVGVVMGGITAISAFTTVSSTAPLLALMIGLAVGIDYSLFILSRHRNQLADGVDPEESAATAVGTAGSAVVFAGITVIIALLGLLVVGIPFLSVMGVGAAFAVLVAIFVATTLLPAILGLAKGRLAPKPGSRAFKRARVHDDETAKPTMGLRWVGLVMKAPIVAVIGVVAILGTLAIPALSLDLNLPDGGSEPKGSTQRQAYELVSDGFGPGYNGPLVIAIDITQTTAIMDDLDSIAADLRKLPGIEEVTQGLPDAGLDTAIMQVIPSTAPDSASTKELVQSIRDLAPSIEKKYGTPIAVTGATAIGIDISNRLTNALVPFGLIVVGLSILLLMMVFRSVLVPIKAALGFLLSVVASFGVVVAIFQWGWFGDLLNVENPGPIISFMPILLMAVLFGLAMDYEVFLVSGMREEFVKTNDARLAVRRGFGHAARVVTAAALIMFFVFFAFVPEGSGAIKPIALGLATGIAFDAFLVRMTLVPAIMVLLGRSAWWLPRWLQRALPDLDIEGEKLREHLAETQWAKGQGDAILSTDGLVSSSGAKAFGPVTARAERGDVVLVGGSAEAVSAFTAVIAGRALPLAGIAQVAGHPLPSEATAVRGLVAVSASIADVPAEESIRGLLAERVSLTAKRGARSRRDTTGFIDRVNAALAPAAPLVTLDASLFSLAPASRAVVLAAIALAERSPVVVVEIPTEALRADEQAALAAAITSLAPAGATIVIGLDANAIAGAAASVAASSGARPTVSIVLADAPSEQTGPPEPLTTTDANPVTTTVANPVAPDQALSSVKGGAQ